MGSGRVALLRALLTVEHRLEAWRRRRGLPDTALVETYRSYGTASELHVKGRVLEDRGIDRAPGPGSRWGHVVRTWKRAMSRELAGIGVAARHGGRSVSGVSDEEGYFHLVVPWNGTGEGGWIEVAVRTEEAPPGEATALVMVPPPEARLAVVSDIDDTVIRSDATSLLRLMRTVLFRDAHVRLPFPGVAALYRALHQGRNPLFYVSSSPWNLYDVLEQIFTIHGIPHGPIFLQDWGLERTKLVVARHEEHKRKYIDTLIGTYATLPFLLIGDSGQHDPEIYVSVARRFPERVLAIYIRDVTPERRHEEVRRLGERLRAETGIEMLLVRETTDAAEHAATRGWIAVEDLEAIRADRRGDQ